MVGGTRQYLFVNLTHNILHAPVLKRSEHRRHIRLSFFLIIILSVLDQVLVHVKTFWVLLLAVQLWAREEKQVIVKHRMCRTCNTFPFFFTRIVLKEHLLGWNWRFVGCFWSIWTLPRSRTPVLISEGRGGRRVRNSWKIGGNRADQNNACFYLAWCSNLGKSWDIKIHCLAVLCPDIGKKPKLASASWSWLSGIWKPASALALSCEKSLASALASGLRLRFSTVYYPTCAFMLEWHVLLSVSQQIYQTLN